MCKKGCDVLRCSWLKRHGISVWLGSRLAVLEEKYSIFRSARIEEATASHGVWVLLKMTLKTNEEVS